jgi:hypothetical protein
MTLSHARIIFGLMCEISAPSSVTRPDCRFIIRRMVIMMDDLPLPEAPQIAIFSSGLISSEMHLRTGGVAGLRTF